MISLLPYFLLRLCSLCCLNKFSLCRLSVPGLSSTLLQFWSEFLIVFLARFYRRPTCLLLHLHLDVDYHLTFWIYSFRSTLVVVDLDRSLEPLSFWTKQPLCLSMGKPQHLIFATMVTRPVPGLQGNQLTRLPECPLSVTSFVGCSPLYCPVGETIPGKQKPSTPNPLRLRGVKIVEVWEDFLRNHLCRVNHPFLFP